MKFYHNNKKRLFFRSWRILVFLAIILGLSLWAYRYRNFLTEESKVKNAEESVQDIPKIEEPKEKVKADNPPQTIDNKALPENALIKMPFTTQSPLAVWDASQEDACEEASIIMVVHYLNKSGIGTKNEAEKEILNLIAYEEKNNYGPSITLKDLSKIAKNYYDLSGEVKIDISIDDIKKEISLGNPVIVPAAGKILPNPNFRNGGPNYHMLVVKGYDKDGFITNDPGTRLGQNFRYSYNDLFNAIHDWDQNNILNGQKAYLTLNK